MKTNTNIKDLIRNVEYSKMHTVMCLDGKTYEYFKLENDGYIYVLCIDTNRVTRYNGEGQNGKRISMDEYLEACTTLESEAAINDLAKAPEQKAPKAKKARKSKDIAYEDHGVTLTAKQVDFIRHLPDTNFWEQGLESALWCDTLAGEIGGQFAGKPMTVGAMISTICEKGLAVRSKERINGRKATYMCLTELGRLVAADLGLR